MVKLTANDDTFDKYFNAKGDYVRLDFRLIAQMPILKVRELSRMYGKPIRWQVIENNKRVEYDVDYRRDLETESLLGRRELEGTLMGTS